MARTFRILPRHLKAAAGPSPEPEGYDFEPGTELVSIPATTEVEIFSYRSLSSSEAL
jgi:hypothetical protein